MQWDMRAESILIGSVKCFTMLIWMGGLTSGEFSNCKCCYREQCEEAFLSPQLLSRFRVDPFLYLKIWQQIPEISYFQAELLTSFLYLAATN